MRAWRNGRHLVDLGEGRARRARARAEQSYAKRQRANSLYDFHRSAVL
jgi:hypothetical protein